MKFLASAVAIAFLTSVQCGAATGATTPSPSPVLIELFTSEGCSSCPPAEKVLRQMDEKQPIPGVQLIVLSEHVDYFNHEGWKDPYSSSQFTQRQYGYVHALGLSDAYTPEMLADGVYDLWGKTSQQAEALIRQPAAAATVPIRIHSVSVDPQVPVLRAHIEVDGTRERHNADIYAAVALDHATVSVLRGENQGLQMMHVAVVQVLKPIGKLKKGETVNTDVAVKLNPGMASENLRLIVFAQESGPGKVVGAALQKDISAKR